MPVRVYKPITPARRGMTSADFDTITKKKPTKSLLVAMKTGSGRNNQGKITIRHRGGGHKRFYRLVDFKFNEPIVAKVQAIEYDPNRTARIALIEKSGGRLAYILAGSGMRPGQIVEVGEEAEIRPGNRLPLKHIPAGSQIYNIELTPGRGGQLARSAGAKAQLLSKEGELYQVKLPSGEVRQISYNAMATLGNVGNEGHQNIKYGSAGRRRHMGWRPRVGGKQMNPVDHPLGGGEGHTSIGLKTSKTPWGKPTLGLRTRRPKLSDKYIVRRRNAGRRGR